MSKNTIIKMLISITFILIIILNNLVFIPAKNINRYITYTFDKSNDELAYVINDLSNEIYSADEEKLKNKEYIEEIFRKANRKLGLWERIMNTLYLLNKNFKFKDVCELKYYFYTIIDKGELTEEDLKVLKEIFETINYINPGIDEEVEKTYFYVRPGKRVKESLEKIFKICEEMNSKYYSK
ncbi:hypothetical protein [Caminicella sporogenes]|uniref:hypothetical protein n=1 Tax=Caminicella sporogenes TaxID=166485 RepID=UPI00254031E5|nr:hypothetical protein [Caminicella sporogenes]WIF94190.1 hypothetical protein QNI18_07705 [Caminicella sporogenes]